MINNAKKLSPLVFATVISTPTLAGEQQSHNSVADALSDSKVKLSFRARYENVEQDGIDKQADALTLKSRLTVTSGSYQGLSAGVEVDNVTALMEDYNSTDNGKGHYPVIADPEGTDVNQAYLTYQRNGFSLTAGRQRINHNNQRFVGGVGWRQNEQTYDGYRLVYKANKQLAFDYAYVFNVNRIFGPNSSRADMHGALHLANAMVSVNDNHKVAGFVYSLDFDSAAGASTDTYGISYNGNFSGVKLNASYAMQSDAGDNPANFDATYYQLELAGKLSSVNVKAGVEVLGSDNGVGFSTPLATLHKFQGFADKFLATPANGVQDIYLGVSTKLGDVNLSATYHDLSADEGNADYGSEIDLTAAYKFSKNYSLLVKYANYSADDLATDTSKLWLQLAANF